MHKTFVISVIVPDTQCCQAREDTVLLAANKGLISNYMTQSSGCGGVDCPWILQASEGQLLNISLLDFGTYQAVSEIVSCHDKLSLCKI